MKKILIELLKISMAFYIGFAVTIMTARITNIEESSFGKLIHYEVFGNEYSYYYEMER